MIVFNNKRSGIIKDCLLLKNKLSKEPDKKLLKAQAFSKPNDDNFFEFDFFISCHKKNGEINYKAEQDLKRRLHKWAQRKGFFAVIPTDKFSPPRL